MPAPAQTYASLAALEEGAARAESRAGPARRLHARVRWLDTKNCRGEPPPAASAGDSAILLVSLKCSASDGIDQWKIVSLLNEKTLASHLRVELPESEKIGVACAFFLEASQGLLKLLNSSFHQRLTGQKYLRLCMKCLYWPLAMYSTKRSL